MDLEFYTDTIKRCYPHIQILRADVLTHGTDHIAVEINNQWMFLFPRTSSVAERLPVQVLVLPELAEALSTAPVPIYQYIWTGDQKHTFPFGGYQKLHGLPFDDPKITPSQLERLRAPLVTFFNELHRFPVSRATQLGVRDSKVAWKNRYEQIVASVFSLLDDRQREKAAALWGDFFTNKVYTVFQSVLTHRDVGGGHILCVPEAGRITGIIDWGDLALGDPAYDFVRLVAERGKAFVERLLERYSGEINASFWQRIDFYLHTYPPYSRVLKAIQAGSQDDLTYWLEYLRTELDKL